MVGLEDHIGVSNLNDSMTVKRLHLEHSALMALRDSPRTLHPARSPGSKFSPA